MLKLKPLIVILGSLREVPLSGVKQEDRKFRSKKNTKKYGETATETKIKSTQIRLYAKEWRAARRLVKNSHMILQKQLGYSTPLGRIAPTSKIKDLIEFREYALAEAAKHNKENRHWQVTVELTWAELSEDAISQLLTITGGELPDAFLNFETSL